MESLLHDFELLEFNESVHKRYSNLEYPDGIPAPEEDSGYIKLSHLKDESIEDMMKIEKKLKYRPHFLKAKEIRDEIGREAFIKSEYSDMWDTYKNTNRVNLSRFLKDMLPYVDKDTMKRLKHGKYFRKCVDGPMKNDELLELAKTPNSYAVLNPEIQFFTSEIIRDLGKKFSIDKLFDMTKDKDLVNEVLEEDDEVEEKLYQKPPRGRKVANVSYNAYMRPELHEFHEHPL